MSKINWIDLNNKPITALPPKCYGFVYILTFTDGMMYIGKKQTSSTLIQPANKTGKKPKGFISETVRIIYRDPDTLTVANSKRKKDELKRRGVKGKKEIYYTVRTESSWKGYEGSSKETEGKVVAKKQIIAYSSNKTTLTYLETRYQFVYNVLHDKRFLGSNILGKFYNNCMDGYIKPPK